MREFSILKSRRRCGLTSCGRTHNNGQSQFVEGGSARVVKDQNQDALHTKQIELSHRVQCALSCPKIKTTLKKGNDVYSAHVNACRATNAFQQTTNNSKNKKLNLQCTLETSSNVTRQRRERTNKHDVGDVDAEPVNVFMAKNASLQRKDAHRTPAMTKSHIWKAEVKRTDSSRGSLCSSMTSVRGVSRAIDHSVL